VFYNENINAFVNIFEVNRRATWNIKTMSIINENIVFILMFHEDVRWDFKRTTYQSILIRVIEFKTISHARKIYKYNFSFKHFAASCSPSNDKRLKFHLKNIWLCSDRNKIYELWSTILFETLNQMLKIVPGMLYK